MNSVCLLGRLTKDPEVRYTQNNVPVCNFTLAVKRRFAKDGEQQADFVNIIAWNKTAEFCSKYFNKGLQVAINGRLQTRNYDDKDGKKVFVTEVVAESVDFAESKNGTAAPQENNKSENKNDNSGFDFSGDTTLPF